MEQLCPWEAANYLIFSSNIPQLLFYSHIPAMVVAILIGLFVYYKSSKSKVGSTLLIINVLFSLWCFFDLILWATNRPDVVMLFWSLQILFEPLIYLLCIYLLFLYIRGKEPAFKWILLGVFIYLPIVLFLSTKYNIYGVNLADCTAAEGFIAQYFTYIVEIVSILLIILLAIIGYRKTADSARKNEIEIFSLGIILFLVAFSWGNIIGSFTDNWTLAQAGLIGMPVFIGFLAYCIVEFKTFNIKLFAAQILIWSLVILIGAQFFFIKVPLNFVLNGITFIGVIIFGYLLNKSVKKEIMQKEELAKLNLDLQSLLKQRETLVHLVTHKVKGAFTRSKYIFSEILEGTYGAISPKIKNIAEQGLLSENEGINTVDLVLNAANLQGGKVKYDMKPVDFKEFVEQVVNDKKERAQDKGLKLEIDIKKGKYTVLGDAFWLKEVAHNLVDNAVKYTLEGGIKVGLEKKDGKILFTVKDSGVGLTDDDKQNLFKEGGRGKRALTVNVDSTGYGLYTVRMIVEAHQGKVWAESAGEGKGSIFTVELPAKK